MAKKYHHHEEELQAEEVKAEETKPEVSDPQPLADHHEGLIEYPTTVPSAKILGIVVKFLRGGDVDPKEATHCVYHVVGYGLGQWDTHTDEFVVEGRRSMSPAQVADLLEAAIADGPFKGVIPWETVIPLLLTMLERALLEWLKK